jgi:hypothetical protein
MRLSVLLIAGAICVSQMNASTVHASSENPQGTSVEIAQVPPTNPRIPRVAPPPPPPTPARVPDEFGEWIIRAGHTCPGITRGLIAAQVYSESSFNRHAVSYANAQGPGQFIPETWSRWGVDANRDGSVDPFSIPDAVMALADFMCHNVATIQAGIDAGKIVGDPVDLALAAYNAGLGAVEEARGMPSGGDYTTQTRPYVAKIRGLEKSYEAEFEYRDIRP